MNQAKKLENSRFLTPNLTLKILAHPFVESEHMKNAVRLSARFLGLSAEENKNSFSIVFSNENTQPVSE